MELTRKQRIERAALGVSLILQASDEKTAEGVKAWADLEDDDRAVAMTAAEGLVNVWDGFMGWVPPEPEEHPGPMVASPEEGEGDEAPEHSRRVT